MFTSLLRDDRLERCELSGELFPRAADRGFWGGDPAWIAAAEPYLDYAWPTIKATDWLAYRSAGDRLAQETPHFARRRALEALLLGELAEYRGRFLSDIANGLLAICEETFWGVSAHVPPPYFPAADEPYIDLFAAETGALLATACYVLHDELYAACPELLTRVEHELDRRIVTVYREHTDFWWMGYNGGRVNNWNPWILSNLLTVFLLRVKERRELTAALRKMLTELERYYASMPADGGCDEGCLYWTRAGGKLFEFCETLYRVTGGEINVFSDAKLREILRYEQRVYIGGGWFVNFADGPARLRGLRPVSLLLYAIAERLEDDAMRDLSGELYRIDDRNAADQRSLGFTAAVRTRLYGEALSHRSAYHAPQTTVLPCLQNAFVRSGDWYYALKGGCNDEGHNHNDVGNLIVFCENRPVIVDPGCGVYTKATFDPDTRYTLWTMRSPWHTLPLINGCEQPYGADCAADAFSLDETVGTVSFAAAYPENAGVTALRRRASVEDGVVWEDTFTFTREHNDVTEYVPTPLSACVDGERVVLDGRFELTADQPCTVTVERMELHGDAHLNACWGQDHLYRVGFHFTLEKNAAVTLRLRRL